MRRRQALHAAGRLPPGATLDPPQAAKPGRPDGTGGRSGGPEAAVVDFKSERERLQQGRAELEDKLEALQSRRLGLMVDLKQAVSVAAPPPPARRNSSALGEGSGAPEEAGGGAGALGERGWGGGGDAAPRAGPRAPRLRGGSLSSGGEPKTPLGRGRWGGRGAAVGATAAGAQAVARAGRRLAKALRGDQRGVSPCLRGRWPRGLGRAGPARSRAPRARPCEPTRGAPAWPSPPRAATPRAPWRRAAPRAPWRAASYARGGAAHAGPAGEPRAAGRGGHGPPPPLGCPAAPVGARGWAEPARRGGPGSRRAAAPATAPPGPGLCRVSPDDQLPRAVAPRAPSRWALREACIGRVILCL